MFVSKSKHDKLKAERDELEIHVSLLSYQLSHVQDRNYELSAKWEDLVTKMNAKGGQAFLDRGEIYGFNGATSQFTVEELKALRRLVHPDKHNGSKSSNDLTTKLNQLLR